MTILLKKKSKIVVQGITGGAGAFHTRRMLKEGTNIVSGVTPGKGDQVFDDNIPIFDTVVQAREETRANVSVIFVPPAFAADSIMDAAYSGIELIVCITEGIPTVDMIGVRSFIEQRNTTLIGPNCPGIVTPNQAKIGIAPGNIFKPGKIGVVSRSGTLAYEAVHQTTLNGLGQTTAIGIGGDPIHGITFVDVLELFRDDPDTEGIILIGEIGGLDEVEAAEFIADEIKVPVVGFIAGVSAPPGKRMGHAGAIIEGKGTSAKAKIKALTEAGVTIAPNATLIGELMLDRMNAR